MLSITMNELTNMLYMVNLAVIRVLKMFKCAVMYIGYYPILAYMRRSVDSLGVKRSDDGPRTVIHNDKFFYRMLCDGTLGGGEAYLDGWYDCDKFDEFAYNYIKVGVYQKTLYPWDRLINYLQFDLFNLQTVSRAREVADKHYNLGNDLFKSFLDKSMNYSCGYWKDAKDLDEAQQHKMELIGRKLKLKPGMRVLDIGCGWGGLCKFLADTYNVEVVGVTISKEGAEEARERCKGSSVEIRQQDYREVNEVFDRIAIVGCLEHVGPKNYRPFFEQVNRCLTEEGIVLLHTIGHDNDAIPPREPFQNKYIFPNGCLPNHKEIPKSIDNIFCIEDWHNFGPDYDKTLMAWHKNFVNNWHTISHLYENPTVFYRMWTFYLLACAAIFRARRFQLWQIVMTKSLPGGYVSVR